MAATGKTKPAPPTPREHFVERWEHYTFWPLIVLGGLFLALYAYPIIWPHLDPTAILDIDITMDIIWGLFVIDFAVKLAVTERRWPFIKRHVIDIIALILPFARPLQAVRAIGVATLALRKFGGKVRHRVTVFVGTMAVFIWFIGGLAITQVERGVPGANIQTVSDGWWWSFMTMATVGFGDRYPVSDQGRAIGAVLVMAGLALLGTLTASIATWFITTSRREEDEVIEAGERRLMAELKKLRGEVAALRAEIDERDGRDGGGGRSGPRT
jgi:voltage-gated potassium channel